MYLTRNMSAVFTAALFIVAGNFAAQAQEQAEDKSATYSDVETKYIFGFTEGSGVGLEGEKEFSLDTQARIGKGGGHYWGSETKFELEVTPNQYFQFEFGPFAPAHSIKDVPDLDNRNQIAFGGVFGEIRYLLLDRTPSLPVSVTLSAEPEWRHTDETSGQRVTNFELELMVNADLELIKNQLYFGMDLLYEPETTHDPDGIGAGWVKESKTGISGALSYRIAPSVFVGGEIWYLRHYDGAWLNSFTGDAVYIGPTLFVRLSPKAFITAAWNVQVNGSDVENPGASLNLSEFSHHRARFKFAFEF